MDKVLAPFKLLSDSKIHYFWIIFVTAFGLVGVLAVPLLGNVDSFFNEFQNGVILTYSVSICAPFIVSFIIEAIVKRKRNEEFHFLNYKFILIIFDILYIVFLIIVWIGELKSSLCLQAFIFVLTSVFAFYLYCVSMMSDNLSVFRDYDDYLSVENKSVENLVEKSSELKNDEIIKWAKNNEKNN